jgi:hypothetical protein
MKKLILATAAAAFVLGTGFANAEDTKQSAPTQKTPTQQQMDTKASNGMKAGSGMQGTTGAGMNNETQSGNSKVPGKPTDTQKDATQGGK